MDKDEEYRRQAADADSRARHATNNIDREAWLKIAQGWRSLLGRPQSDDESK